MKRIIGGILALGLMTMLSAAPQPQGGRRTGTAHTGGKKHRTRHSGSHGTHKGQDTKSKTPSTN